MYSYVPLHMAKQKQEDQLEHTYSSYVSIRDVALKTCQKRWDDREKLREKARDIRASGHDMMMITLSVCELIGDFIYLLKYSL